MRAKASEFGRGSRLHVAARDLFRAHWAPALPVREARRVVSGIPRDVRAIVVTTLVRFHGALGRVYFVPVRPAHRLIVPAMARRAALRLADAQRQPPRSSN